MSLTTYQKELFTFIKSRGEATSAELVDEFGCRTPYAPNKYVGLALSRMVKNGFLIRVKKGVFKAGTGTKSKPSTIAEGQATLFDI